MGDKSKIQWLATPMIRSDSGTIRWYRRKNPNSPGAKLRRLMESKGMRWCRGCREWLRANLVVYGACRMHLNREYRKQYASNPHQIRARVYARKRKIGIISLEKRTLIMETFHGRCAYCHCVADTIDHAIPVAHGGTSDRGNLLPACTSCNSKKRTKSLEDFLKVAKRPNIGRIIDELVMEHVL